MKLLTVEDYIHVNKKQEKKQFEYILQIWLFAVKFDKIPNCRFFFKGFYHKDQIRRHIKILYIEHPYLRNRSYKLLLIGLIVLNVFANFTGKHLWWSLFLNKFPGLRLVTLFWKWLRKRRFPVSFVKFLKLPFLQNTTWTLLFKRADQAHYKRSSKR